MTPRTPHARPHAGMGAPTARTARTAHPPVRGCGVARGVEAPRAAESWPPTRMPSRAELAATR